MKKIISFCLMMTLLLGIMTTVSVGYAKSDVPELQTDNGSISIHVHKRKGGYYVDFACYMAQQPIKQILWRKGKTKKYYKAKKVKKEYIKEGGATYNFYRIKWGTDLKKLTKGTVSVIFKNGSKSHCKVKVLDYKE